MQTTTVMPSFGPSNEMSNAESKIERRWSEECKLRNGLRSLFGAVFNDLTVSVAPGVYEAVRYSGCKGNMIRVWVV